MYCYVLQGTLGVLALAVLLALGGGVIWGVVSVADWLDRYAPVRSGIGEAITKWVLGPIFGAVGLYYLSVAIWELGGATVHQFFRFCVGN